MARENNQDMYFADKRSQQIWRAKHIISRIFLYLFLTLFALFILLPFWFMVITSLKHPDAYEAERINSVVKLWADHPTIYNFQVIFGMPMEGEVASVNYNFGQFFLNTIIFALIATSLTVVSTVLTAFAFARLDFKGKEALFALLLATMMIPGEMMIITNYQTIDGWMWKNTFAGLTLTNFVSVFYIFYLRQAFQMIPNELYLASKVDGYGEFQYLWKVMIPVAMPTITTITILSVMGAWNAYIWPRLIANGTHPKFGNDMRLVSNGLMSLFKSAADGKDTIVIAGSMVVTAPLLLIFVIFRQYIMRGVSRSGIKG